MLSKVYNHNRGSSHSYICDAFYFNATHFAFSHGTLEILSQFNFLLNSHIRQSLVMISQLRYFAGARPSLKPKRPLSQVEETTNKNKSAKNMNTKEKDPCKNHGKVDAHGFNSILKINQ